MVKVTTARVIKFLIGVFNNRLLVITLEVGYNFEISSTQHMSTSPPRMGQLGDTSVAAHDHSGG